jgi:hypothetical protein
MQIPAQIQNKKVALYIAALIQPWFPTTGKREQSEDVQPVDVITLPQLPNSVMIIVPKSHYLTFRSRL